MKIVHQKQINPYSILFLFLLFFLGSCSIKSSENPYLTGDKSLDSRLEILLNQLPSASDDIQRYGINEQIISLLKKNKNTVKLNLFLTNLMDSYPKDSFNAYYLLVQASLYEEEGAYDIASLLYHRILKNYEDLIIDESSIHSFCLNKLVVLSSNNLDKIDYYQELLSRFSDNIDRGSINYTLAKAYEAEGLWSDSIQKYKDFLQSPPTTIPGEPNVYNEVNHYLKFVKSKKDWTFYELNSLVSTIKYSIRTRNGNRLTKYKGVDFFMMSWGQDRYDPYTQIPMDLRTFLSSYVWYNRYLSPESNESEAYLKTGGWSYRIKTWYLYFKRVRYPIDPEINGRWEWAGIYFGDQL